MGLIEFFLKGKHSLMNVGIAARRDHLVLELLTLVCAKFLGYVTSPVFLSASFTGGKTKSALRCH